MKTVYLILAFVIVVCCSACNTGEYKPEDRSGFAELQEVSIHKFILDSELNNLDLEISGLAWYKDYLVILPQFPFKFGNGLYGTLFLIEKDDLYVQIRNGFNSPLPYKKISLETYGSEQFNTTGSGYEGITFVGDDVYFVIESRSVNETCGYLVKGEVDWDNNKIIINDKSIQKNIADHPLDNTSDESVTSFNDQIITIYEANGIWVNENPCMNVFSRDLKQRHKISMPHIEYRITDATRVSADSTFWVINYMWKGDMDLLKPDKDVLFEDYGVGKSQKNSLSVERLVKLKFLGDEIEFVPVPPVYIEIPKGVKSRNWEGIVEMDDAGFIMATDKHPGNLLAFVPFHED